MAQFCVGRGGGTDGDAGAGFQRLTTSDTHTQREGRCAGYRTGKKGEGEEEHDHQHDAEDDQAGEDAEPDEEVLGVLCSGRVQARQQHKGGQATHCSKGKGRCRRLRIIFSDGGVEGQTQQHGHGEDIMLSS